MNKKLIALLLTVVMLLTVGCGRKDDTEGTNEPSQSVEAGTDAQLPDETIPGVEILDESLSNPFDEMEENEQADAENGSASSDNNAGNTGNGNSQSGSNNGNSNTDETTQSGGEASAETQPTGAGSSNSGSESLSVSYEEYNSMTPEAQVAYYNQFSSMEAFVKWYNEAKAAYDAEHGSIEVGDGNIDLGDLVKP